MIDDALDALSSCQCCLLGGQQRSLKTLYIHLGKTEIYSDMLKECFDIRLGVGSEKTGICEVCVGRLRDASEFKQQVQRSQLELRKRLKRALQLLEEEPAAAVKGETDEGKRSCDFLGEEHTVELSDDDGASPVTVMREGHDVNPEETVEDGMRDYSPAVEEPAAAVKPEIDEGDQDATNDNSSDENHSIKSENADDAATSNEYLSQELLKSEDYAEASVSEDITVSALAVKGNREQPRKTTAKPEKKAKVAKLEDKPAENAVAKAARSLSPRAREQLAMTCSVRLEPLNGLEAHVCQLCHMMFDHESSLATHMMEHDDNQIHTDTYICDVRKKQFTLRAELERHISEHAREKPFKCEICNKQFNEKGSLKRHVRIHTGQKYSCDMCNKQFADKSNLKRHVTFHAGLNPFKCDTCNKQFALKSSLKAHINIHTGQKPFKCEICYKQFNHKGALKIHVRIHTGQILFKCEICYKQFNEERSLKRHVRIHTGQKYSCDMCNKQFADKSNLRRHIKIHRF